MTLEMIESSYDLGLRGDGGTTADFVCDESEMAGGVTFLLGSQMDTVAPSSNMYCKTVKTKRRKDLAGNKWQLSAVYAPKFAIEALTIDLPLKWRLEASGECVTISGSNGSASSGYKWANGDPLLNQRVLPVKRFTLAKVVMYGTRSVFDLGTYMDLVDHVNSDNFLGASEETIFFESVQCQQHQLMDGTIVYAIELHLIYRPSGWNLFFREDVPAGSDQMQRLLDQDGDPVYPSAALAVLLDAPATTGMTIPIFDAILTGSPPPIDLTAIGTPPVDLTGKRVTLLTLKAKSTNVGPVTVSKGATDGYDIGGTFSVTLLPGQVNTVQGTAGSDVVGPTKYLLDVSGTEGDTVSANAIAVTP
jgi:hypothetical protein